MSEVVDDGNCFACGPHNEDGLHLRFVRDGEDGAIGTVILDQKYQGYRGIAHGGIVMMLLDEVMAHATGMNGDKGMTASINVRFRKPVPLGVELTLRGRVTFTRSRMLALEGTVELADGTIHASSEGQFISRGKVDPGLLGTGAIV
jgi:uncharacterized protein (TIGR00369 family)